MTTRDSAIERVRIVAVFAAVAAHASVPYLTRPVPDLLWPVQEGGSRFADLAFWWARCAQPQLFFFIGGLISVLILDDRGIHGFVTARLRRLGVPLLAGIVFVLPAVAAVWTWGWLQSGRVTWAEVRAWRFADVEIQRNVFGPAHLWFLQDLLIISALFALWRWWRRGEPHTAAGSRLTPLLLFVAAVTLLTVRPAVVFHAPNTFVPDVLRLAFGGTFFVGGVWFAHRRDFLSRCPPLWLLLPLAAAAAMVTTARVVGQNDQLIPRIALAVSATATAWLSIAAALQGATKGTVALSVRTARLALDSYAIYVIHLPLVGAMHIALLSRAWPAIAKVFVTVAVTVMSCVILVNGARRSMASAAALSVRLRAVPVRAWTLMAVVLGISLRLFHYLRNPDVWLDEAALLVNVVERSYAGLLAPLTYHETAPPLFLWIQRWIAVNVGDSTWAMRLVPTIASCAALVAFVPMTRVIDRQMAPIAVLLMASSVKVIAHSVEAKPYALDVLLATAATSAFVLTDTWSLPRRAALFALLGPVLIWSSYPGVFVMAAIVAALAFGPRPAPARRRLALAAPIVTVAVSFAFLFVVPVQAQRSAQILEYWRWAFPATFAPMAIVEWGARALVGIADYCFRPFGGVLLVPIAVGVGALLRRRLHACVVVLMLPLVLAAVAGLAGQYPFSGSRVMVFVLPAFALLAAEGLGVILSRTSADARLLRATVIALVIAPPLALCAREVISPSPRPDTAAASAFVLDARTPDELVAAGSWEYRYYLRHLGASFVKLDEQPLPIANERIWCIVHGETAGVRRQRVIMIAGTMYEIGRAVDFHGVSVFDLNARR